MTLKEQFDLRKARFNYRAGASNNEARRFEPVQSDFITQANNTNDPRYAEAQDVLLRVIAVAALPPIPSSGMLEVFLTPDNQVWRAYAGQTEWTPTQAMTEISGVP